MTSEKRWFEKRPVRVQAYQTDKSTGIAHPSVVVLARTNALVGKLSTILGQKHSFKGHPNSKPMEDYAKK